MTDKVEGREAAMAVEHDSGKAAPGAPVEAAWERYQRAQGERRARLLGSEFATDPAIRAQGLYFLHSLDVAAFNLYVAPRQHYPALYVQSFFMPLELSWGTPNPDFLNHNGFIDGRHSYRIYGNKRGIDWATIQVFKGFWGDEQQGTLANIDFDDVPVAADGSFEILLGPNAPAAGDARYWVRIDPQARNMMLAMREVFYDWTRDDPMEVHIEMLDREPDSPIFFDEEELALRIDKSGKWAAACFDLAMLGAKRLRGERNRFDEALGGRQQGGSPLGHWFMMVYDLRPDEALIVDMPEVAARYWGIQLASVWGQTTDYSYHQSSINCTQAQRDADGRVRVVIALQDPGVPNWLDPAGLPLGSAVLRFYKADEVVAPAVTRVPLSEVRWHLPPETPVVATAQRRAQLDARRAGSLRRYGQ
jgi:hypothetical protein